MGKWTEVPYIQTFIVFYQNPALYGSCISKSGEPENSPDVLDYPLLSSSVSRGETKLSLLLTVTLLLRSHLILQSHLLFPVPLTDPKLHLPMCLHTLRYPKEERLGPLC